MKVSDFDFDLPQALIAQRPAAQRSAARLLHLQADTGLTDRSFSALPGLLRAGDLLVMNDSRVVPARLHGSKASGGRIEMLLERTLDSHRALVQLRASKSPPAGSRLHFRAADATLEGAQALVTGRQDEFFELRFDEPVLEVLERLGHLPLPPYITHAPDADDSARYQTVYARERGSVAAPTAGLHFDAELLEALRAAGVETAFVTLHVGAGTFQPVRTETPEGHRMHLERYSVPAETRDAIQRARARGGRVVAVGTTTLRTLESACEPDGLPAVCTMRETRLFVRPGYRFGCVDRLITNFHLPRSTLLMLVAAFAGTAQVMAAYRHAIAAGYRFFSYGDAMFVDVDPPRATTETP